ncbi:flagellar P-ring protein FlgI [Petrotoga sp. HKA.pet.4.5]|jgi:flagellar P-ring protein precursor FlgI|uniref:flagellar basal body P-ring protein FlgI n=1 Tax=unclassified Petrotoga TaxID=2620614 RepID=UPI000EF15CCF|nr:MULTISPECIES: flagellar basal body P-ring protein FlgI [unclassified Petrotoga]MBL5981042.1 flagellar P-ring protein FlgI [Petrotoga sp. 8T1HF07.NaAc.6.1]RLL83929.1 flagellar P-ring protein FlgI [Petrotoga sp. Shatin.DS.tank11.9.2.9.3]RLL90178.1 flagellar P-ring protein FlgI [Petrotoga sp. HKA.pet.4.5]
MRKNLFVTFLLILIINVYVFAGVRIKDISDFRGARDNQLFGIGLVTGLNGSGDSGDVPSEMINNMLANFNINLTSYVETENTALVMVFADIPSFYKEGMRLDVTVAAIGDSDSIENGVLMQTPLYGADNKVYAVAQGNVLTGGANIRSSSNLQERYKVVGYIPEGAIIEKEIPAQIVNENTVTINLKQPDITTSARVANAINSTFSLKIAKALDPSSIRIEVPKYFEDDIISFLALIEEIEITPDVKAKIVINEKTGTIVLGGDVEIADFTVSYGNFSVSVENGKISGKPATISNLITALKTAGATPQDIIAIIQSAQAYLYADLVVM